VQLISMKIVYPGLPLAVYREIAAHLRQVEGVEVELARQDSQRFDYNQSQIGSLQIAYPDRDLVLVEAILSYYDRRYGDCDRQFLNQ
jgi:hypothetical protein